MALLNASMFGLSNAFSGWSLPGSFQGASQPWWHHRLNLTEDGCRCFPGDTCWPSTDSWAALNRSLSGRFIKTTPLASPCHDSQFGPYNEDICNGLKNTWTVAATHDTSPSSIMAPFFANQSCDPFLEPSSPCVVSTYAQYSVNVSEPSDVEQALRFAEKHNIRLVIKNTGHDYNGKDTGAGSISLWVHNLQSTEILHHYQSNNYSGKALRVGAGVEVEKAYAVAHSVGHTIVGARQGSIALAGGYIQGSGHSPLTSKLGLAADNVLEFEVIDRRGVHIIASPSMNPDLFWALADGGGGTYAVVLAATV